ncbi:MAG: DUF4290 domain-containing protein [Bacteroidota bacterium]|nr:DUF4290 domain-containing protein [Bacteroidota bacterium]
MTYNTEREFIQLREYGRNIHTMVQNLLAVEDREKRNLQALQLIEIMKQFIQPGIKDNIDLAQKVWDDLYIISNFNLDVDGPYPKPDASIINKRPESLKYSQSEPRLRHYGKNIEILVKQISLLEEGTEKENAIIYLARLMKHFYAQYNKEVLDDIVIKDQLELLSGRKLTLDMEKVKNENLLDAVPQGRRENIRNNDSVGLNNNPRRNNKNNRNRNRGRKK